MTTTLREPTVMSSLLGQTLGRYVIQSRIGQGGMAEVYRARDAKLGRDVAVKVILPQLAAESHFTERFLREARLVAALEHPNVLPIYDFGEHQGLPFLVMPLVTGGTLAGRLQGEPLPLELVLGWARQLAAALDAAHAAGVLHRDVKPANVLLGKEGRLFLADFGIAKLADATTRLTATGMAVGTPVYMAPEVVAGKPAAPAADLYALAVMVYEMLAGKPPFEGENALSILHQHATRPVPPLSEQVDRLPAGIDGALEQGLAKDPDTRPTSCGAFVDSLVLHLPAGAQAASIAAIGASSDCAPTLPLPSPPPVASSARSPATPVSRRPRTARRWMWTGLAAGALAVAAVVWLQRYPATSPGTAEEPPSGELAAPSPVPPPPASAVPAAPPPSAPSVQSEPARREPEPPPVPRDEERPPPANAPRPFLPPAGDPGQYPQRLLQSFRGQELREGERRPTERELRAAAEVGSRADAGEHPFPAAEAIASYGRGGLALLAGDLDTAGRLLADVAGDERFLRFWGPSVFTFLTRPGRGGDFAAWEIALGYGDPLATAGAEIDRRLAAAPDDLDLRFARVLVDRLDGEHRKVIAGASRLCAELGPSPAELKSYAAQVVADAQADLGRLDDAFDWYQRAWEAGGRHRGAVAFEAAMLARGQGRRDEAVRFLGLACGAGVRAACLAERRGTRPFRRPAGRGERRDG